MLSYDILLKREEWEPSVKVPENKASIQEAEAGGSKLKANLDYIGSRPCLQKGRRKWGWECSSVVECLASMHKALVSIPSTGKKLKKKKKED
jgi:hypothetical protein